MDIVSIGGGPAGLFFGILMKRADPAHRIRIVERNGPHDTFGWGVVFSDETLGNIADADPETYAEITRAFAHWDDIDIHYQGAVVTSTGHGFSGMSRLKLLNILQARATALGVEIQYNTEVGDLEAWRDADVILAADGVNSRIRELNAAAFAPQLDMRPNKFVWLGSTLRLDTFLFVFKTDAHGLWRVHAYQFDDQHSTFIVETTDETWRKAGLETASEDETVGFCERLFADELKGHRLLKNKPVWRNFPIVRCGKWSAGNVVLMGDAAHGAFLDRLRHQARDGGFDRARARAGPARGRARGAGGVRGRAPAAGRVDPARRPDEPAMVRGDRALFRHARAAAVRRQPADPLAAHHPREFEAARSDVRAKTRPLVRRQGGQPERPERRRRAAAAADVHALQAARPRAVEPRRGLADVPVLGRGRAAERLAPGASGQPRGRRRRADHHRDDRHFGRGADQPGLRRAVQARARRGVAASSSRMPGARARRG